MASALRFGSIDPSVWEEDSSLPAAVNLTVMPSPTATATPLPSPSGSPHEGTNQEVVTLPVDQGRSIDPLSRSRLTWFKQFSSIACGVLVVSSALAYGHRVYLDQQSDQAQARLDQLQQDERQLTIVIEALKYQAAQLADAKGSDLVRQSPDHVIFLEPSLSRPDRASSKSKTIAPPRFPVSY